MRTLRCNPARQRGAAAVEFALTAIAFLTLVIGAMEFSRLMLTWNMAVETTRLGARVAVVCDKNDPAIRRRMRDMLPALSDSNIVISYPAAGCTSLSCEPVTVRIVNFDVPLIVPFIPLNFTLPSLATSLPSESLSSTDNPLCD
ncbi:TadE/TadG family type IV pilus assembly protein [Quisquiliibacterium transsilvanicum]|uniref:TadE-like domain-containing protein n=1 Tax=Quisquiliibacterium transsilvanicum TaxID=1549638 RepID=A0A7W8HFI7_9BURK|nr:TadE family protein [Quisquiliibacterium transsilvanicum]MBB5271055.1 hypothetical protein [Quisquiliibacterium transsilvanicum]